MARYHSRCNLSAARFPLTTDLSSRTIILPQHDMNYQRNAVFSGSDADRDIGVPQVFYCHNTLPTEQGFQSVGYDQVIAPVGGATEFDQIIPLLEVGGNKFLFSPSGGLNHVFDAPVGQWESINPITGVEPEALVTFAFVQGNTYIYYEKVGAFRYNSTTKAFDSITLVGLDPLLINGIVGSNGYLLAFDNTTMYWSSAVDPLDFVPSLITGAGSGAVTDLKGRIVAALPNVNGFLVYGTGNAVGASFTSNIRFPFIFKEVPGSGGILSKEQVSHDVNTEDHYALTSAGLQQITKTSSKLMFPELTDFLTSRIFEDYDSATKTFITTTLSADMIVKITVVASRYLVISYGIASLTHALIFDLAQKRWGKAKINHVDCFEFNYPNLYGEITYEMLMDAGTLYTDLMGTSYLDLFSAIATANKPKRTLAFLQSDGTVMLTNFDLGRLADDAVFLLGKYQFTRGHYLQLLGFEVENANPGANFAAFVLPSRDGKNFEPAITPFLKTNNGKLREYACRVTGVNNTLLFTGTYNLVGTLIRYTPLGMIR
jgi:hypothetical protein